MNSFTIASVNKKESIFGSGQYKKSKRRRNRNKYRNSNSRKKRLKRCNSRTEANTSTSKFNIGCEEIMSNWYWSNYKKAVEWQDRHKVAHWKACALALYEENQYLLQIIRSIQPGIVPQVPLTQSNLTKGCSRNTQELGKFSRQVPNELVSAYGVEDVDLCEEEEEEEEQEQEEEDSDDNEFEMSEEMMQFFEQSYKHKMDLQKLKEEELIRNTELEIKQIQTNKMKRSAEMNWLYGEGASMIIGMETAVQLSFDKYCDIKSPQYWPNIPLRL